MSPSSDPEDQAVERAHRKGTSGDALARQFRESILAEGARTRAEDRDRIFAAAIRVGPSVYAVPSPARHDDVIAWLERLGVPGVRSDQGFVTNGGRFVGRREALLLAEAAGQVAHKHGNPSQLFSEDMW